MAEQTMTGRELLDAYEAGRTQHMETQPIRGEFDPRWGDDLVRGQGGKVQYEDVLVVTAEVQHEGTWRKLEMVGTDGHDEAQPLLLQLEPRVRVTKSNGDALGMDDTFTVRGLSA